MKKSMLKAFLVFFLLAAVAHQSNAGGIPTMDLIGMTQRILAYAQEIQKYEEMISQTSKMTDQYVQLVRTYQQKLREYNHYLNQLKSLKNRIDNKDWLSIMRFIRLHGFIGRTKLAQVQAMDPDNSAYDDKMDEALGDFGYVPRRPEQVEADAATVGVWTNQLNKSVNRNWNNYERLKERMTAVTYNERNNDSFSEKISAHQEIADALGDEDDLATQQAKVRQGITIMEQNNEIHKTLNQILSNLQEDRAKEASIRAEEIDEEIDRLKNRVPSQGLGRDTILP